jgi:arginyl-tRNA synthetase
MNILKKVEKIFQESIKKLSWPNTDVKINLLNNSFEYHFTTEIAFIISKKINQNVLYISETLIKEILKNENLLFQIQKIKSGYINFNLNSNVILENLRLINNLKSKYGKKEEEITIKNYNIEFLSANPNGYLHIGHARNAIIGNSLTKMLRFYGFNVSNQSYINDQGNQIEALKATIFYYYQNYFLRKKGEPIKKKKEIYYQGSVYKYLAFKLIDLYQDKYINNYEDDLKTNIFTKFSIAYFIKKMNSDLKKLNIKIDKYVYESEINPEQIENVIQKLKNNNFIYKKEDSLWLKTTLLNDDKDRVIKRSNKTLTYFAYDLVYHHQRLLNIFQKNKQKENYLINILGADHHGYEKRIYAGLNFLGWEEDKVLKIFFYQNVSLTKKGKIIKMSKRKGKILQLKDILKIINKDALKYILLRKNYDSPVFFDVEKLEKKNKENMFFYCQYAFVRCFNLLKKMKNTKLDQKVKKINLKEEKILSFLIYFPYLIKKCVKNYNLKWICDYLENLSNLFHNYYQTEKIINQNKEKISWIKKELIKAICQIIKNIFKILNINCLKKM